MKVCRRDLRALVPVISARSRSVGGGDGSTQEGSSVEDPSWISGTTRVMKAERPLSGDEIDLVPSLTIIEDAVKTHFVGGLGSLEGTESKELDVIVEKSDGELKVHTRHDDEGDRHGLFVHGFRPGSLAEGVLEIGDELLEANGHVVKSKYLEDLVLALRDHDDGKPFVSMKVCRRDLRALAPIVSAGSIGVGSALGCRLEGSPEGEGSSSTPGGTRVLKAERPLSGDEIDLVPSLTIIEDAVKTHFVDGLGSLEGTESKELDVIVEKSDGELKVHEDAKKV